MIELIDRQLGRYGYNLCLCNMCVCYVCVIHYNIITNIDINLISLSTYNGTKVQNDNDQLGAINQFL